MIIKMITIIIVIIMIITLPYAEAASVQRPTALGLEFEGLGFKV